MLVYLDSCCYNRPFDDQSDLVIRLETEAKLRIQFMARDGQIGLVWSGMLDYENDDNPFWERKERISKWEDIADIVVEIDEHIVEKARKFMRIGLKNKDAIHLACAVRAKADFFITTDKRILNKVIKEINIVNPIDFVRKELL
jgi:hypothetical protein